jgi:small-conductance mechanosensitive channel
VAAVVAVGIWLVGWLLGGIVIGRVRRIARRTTTELDDVLLGAVRRLLPVAAGLVGIAAGAHQAPLSPAALSATVRGVQVAFVLALTFLAAGLLSELVRRQAARMPGMIPASTLTQNLIRIVVVGLGLLVVAAQLGIAITPILTALGVGSLAVALALQPTLTNFFAGFHVTIARQIRVGDFVKLESGEQGYVEDIGWRSTQIRELPNNLIIVPNAKLADIVVKNYSLPETEQAALVQVGVAYASDLAQVERVTLEVARATLREVEGGVPEFEPLVRYHTFGDSSIGFTVVLRVRQFADRYLVTHQFIQRLHRRYAAEGIEIPFPQRVVTMAGRGAAAPGGALDAAARPAPATVAERPGVVNQPDPPRT